MESKALSSEVLGSGNWHLAMQWSYDGFHYTCLNLDEKKYYGYQKIELTGNREEKIQLLNSQLENDSVFLHPFKSSSLLIECYKAMLIPEKLFDSNNLKAFLKFHHEMDDKDFIKFVSEKAAETFIVFSIPAYLEQIVEKYHSEVKYSHHSQPLIDHALRFTPTTEDTNFHLHFGKDFFDVLIVRNHKILLFNSFFYKKYADVVYFVINILNLYSLHPDHTKLLVSGWITEKSDIETELRKIFKKVQFAQYSLDFKYADELRALPNHTFVNLLNLYNCE